MGEGGGGDHGADVDVTGVAVVNGFLGLGGNGRALAK